MNLKKNYNKDLRCTLVIAKIVFNVLATYIRVCTYMGCMSEEFGCIGGVDWFKSNGGGGQSSGGLGGKVGAGMVGVDPVRGARGGHVLRPLPTFMV